MSKYSFSCTPSRWRQLNVGLPMLAFGICLASMPDAVQSYLTSYTNIALWLVTLVVVTGWKWWAADTRPHACQWHVSANGDIQLDTAYEGHAPVVTWQLSPRSRATWWGLLMVLKQQRGQQQRRLWVLKGEVSEQNYRRLCRQVIQNHA